MLDPADILVDRQPLFRVRFVERLVDRLTCEADEVPAGIHERVESVGLAKGRASALRATRASPILSPVERIARHVEGDVRRQDHRKLLARDRDWPALLAVDHRDRRAPVTLARDAPVT